MKVPSIKALLPSFPQKGKAVAIAVEALQSGNTGASHAASAPSSFAGPADTYAIMAQASKSNQYKLFGWQGKEKGKEEGYPFQTQFALSSGTDDPGFNKKMAASHRLHQHQSLNDLRIIDAKSKEIRPELLKVLSRSLPDLLDKLLDPDSDHSPKSLNKPLLDKDSLSLVKAASAELKNTLSRLNTLAKAHIALADHPYAIPGLEDKDLAQKLGAQHLGEAVRDCYADAAKICEKYVKKAGNGSTEKTKLATLSALFTELKRHHLAASATPAFEAFSKAEVKRMKQATPGMVESRAGAAVANMKEFSLDIGFGTSKLIKGQVGVEGGSAEELIVDATSYQNRWDLTHVTGKAAANLSAAGFLTGKLEGKLKVSAGKNYAEIESYADQAKIFARHKNKDAYINKFWNSAGPTARKWKKSYKKIQKYMKWGTGANYKSVSAPTHLTERKIAKGASNTGAIHALAEMMSAELGACMKDFYPPLERPMSYSPLSAPAGGVGLRGKEGTSITIVEGTFEGSLKAGIPGLSELTDGYLDFAAEGKLALKGRRRDFNLERLKPSHVLLSGAYTKDMRKSLDLWNMIETRSKNDSRLESKLKLYERVKGAIGNVIDNARSTNAPHQHTSYDIAYFGPVTDIPETFLNTIHVSESNLEAVVNAVAAQCEQLGQDYATFQQHAGLLHAVSQRGASKKAKDQYAALHRDAFEKINKSAWGRADGSSASGVKLADLVSSSSKRVEFLADSYDAISTALGGAGTYLEIVKAKVAEMENPPLALVKAIEKADKSYSKASGELVRAELPMHEDSLHRYNSIAWTSVSSKNEIEREASIEVGLLPGLDSILSGVLEADVELDTSSLGIAATLNHKVFTADHPNPTRGGDFREVTLTLRAGAGPLTEAVVEKAAIFALTKMRKELGGVKLTVGEIHALRDSIKTGLSTVALDTTKGLVLSWRHHKFSKAGDDAWRQQYFRIEEETKDMLSVSRTIPTPIPGLTVKPGMRIKQSLKNVLCEMMGIDISHHVLSCVRLDELRGQAKKKQKAEAKLKAAAQADGAAVADELALLKEEFEADPFRKNQFFSTNAILDVVKDYQDFLAWKKEGSPLDKQPNSGFVFYDSAEMQDIAKNARKVDSLAAGKSAFTVEMNEEGIEETRKPKMRSSLSDPLTDIASKEELEAFEKRMEQELEERQKKDPEATLTPDDRVRLLLATEEGKKIFNSYTNIVSTYKELTDAATTLLGYETRLREEMPKAQTARRLGVAGKRAGAALMSMFDGTGLHPSPEAGTEAANTLSQRGYFSPEMRRNHGDLAHGVVPVMLANTWFARHDLAKADNDLDGMHSLIVALLQHATGRYNSLHVEEAARYLKMCDRHISLSANMEKVASAINRDHGKMQVHMIAPDSTNHGVPAWIDTLGASQQKDVRSVVIMRSKNVEGKDTFTSIVHRKRALAPDVPEHLKQLDKAKVVKSVVMNDALPNRDAGLTGIEQREAMKIIGTQQRGRISSFMKNASASLADMRRPDRKTVRELKYKDLKTQIDKEIQSYGVSTRYWREAVKEKKKRDNNTDMLTSAAMSRSPEEMTGKELRKEIKATSPDLGVLLTPQQLASRFKRQSKTAEVMTRMTHLEIKDIAQNAKHPKIQEAAENELKKREEMEATLAKRRNLRTQR